MADIQSALDKLEKSKFRSSFYLTQKDRNYYYEKGEATIRKHAEDFVRMKLSAAYPEKDGKQTPTSGHPAFKAMHATACCCRGCLNKWYRVPLGVELSEIQQQKIVNLIMAWINRQINNHS